MTVKELATEIIAVCNAYKQREITEQKLKDICHTYADMYPDKLFDGSNINPTIKKMIGKKRIFLLEASINSHKQLSYSEVTYDGKH